MGVHVTMMPVSTGAVAHGVAYLAPATSKRQQPGAAGARSKGGGGCSNRRTATLARETGALAAPAAASLPPRSNLARKAACRPASPMALGLALPAAALTRRVQHMNSLPGVAPTSGRAARAGPAPYRTPWLAARLSHLASRVESASDTQSSSAALCCCCCCGCCLLNFLTPSALARAQDHARAAAAAAAASPRGRYCLRGRSRRERSITR